MKWLSAGETGSGSGRLGWKELDEQDQAMSSFESHGDEFGLFPKAMEP